MKSLSIIITLSILLMGCQNSESEKEEKSEYEKAFELNKEIYELIDESSEFEKEMKEFNAEMKKKSKDLKMELDSLVLNTDTTNMSEEVKKELQKYLNSANKVHEISKSEK